MAQQQPLIATPAALPASPARRVLKYWAIFKAQVSNNLAYTGDLVTRSISIVSFMWIFAQLWRTTYQSAGLEVIGGLSLHDTLWYLMLAETIVLSKPRLSLTIAETVKDGAVAYLLNKPYNFLLYHFSLGLGDSILQMLFNLLAGGAMVWLLVGPPPPVWGWPLAIMAIILAWLIDFCLAAMIGLTAFLTEEVAAFDWIYSKVLFLLGGLLIPLDFFPEWLQTIAHALPFAYTVYGPARLFVEPDLWRFAGLLLGQLAWLAVLGGLLALFYRRSVSWLSINGG
jgi:ABC-2 type transport system permease protein